MDLPIEIRQIIAEFVLRSDNPLEFKWVAYAATKMKGIFEGLRRLTALTRTSKQVHIELSNMVWRVNTFYFDSNMDLNLPRDSCVAYIPQDPEPRIREAVKFFARKVRPQRPGCIMLGLSMRRHNPTHIVPSLGTLIRDISNITGILPGSQWKLIDLSWKISTWGGKRLTKDLANELTRFGQSLKRRLSQNDIASSDRDWRVYPRIVTDSIEKTTQKLVAAGVEEAEKRIEEGL